MIGAASALRKEAGTLGASVEQAVFDRELKVTMDNVSSEAFKSAWTEGEAMKLENMIEFATS